MTSVPRFFLSIALTAKCILSTLYAAPQWDLDSAAWDADKPGPGGEPSLRIEPGGKARLKLADRNLSGKVSMAVWDDGTAAVTARQKSAKGPRWGISTADGRVLVGGIMYARYLSPGGSLAIIDAAPADPGSWFKLKYLSGRSPKPGWQTWEFDFDPSAGLTLSINGKPVSKKRFDWNESEILGLNGIVIYGDETGSADAQTFHVADIRHETGPPMEVEPFVPPIVPDEDPPADKVWSLRPELRGKHPRLLLTEAELPALRAFYHSEDGKIHRERIEEYVAPSRNDPGTKWLRDATDGQRQGFWRLPTVALHYLMTGDTASLEAARNYLRVFNEQPDWETTGERNSGMSAANIMIGAALAYDWIYHELDPDFRREFGEKLLYHARAMYYGGHLNRNEQRAYWQNDPANNHRWHRNAGLTLTILAVYEGREDQRWILEKAIEDLEFVRKWLPHDGSCHEGPNYFTFGGNHLTVAFEAADIALGTDFMDADYFKNAGRFRMATLLPGMQGIFSFGDGTEDSIGSYNNFLYAAASHHRQPDVKDGLLAFQRAAPKAFLFGWFSLLWDDPELERGDRRNLPEDLLFEDIGFATLRENWDDDAVAASFKCGPWGGYDLLKFAEGGRKYINVAHDDPDAGEFLIAKGGTTLVKTGGYSKRKASRNHNTILVNGLGQMTKGRPEGGVWSQPSTSKGTEMTRMAYLTSWKSTEKVTAVEGEASGSYLAAKDRKTGKERPAMDRFRRSFLWVEGDYILVLDDIRAPETVRIDWLVQGGELEEIASAEGRYRLSDEGESMDFLLRAETPVERTLRVSPADHQGKAIGLRQLMATTEAANTRFASAYDPWDRTLELAFEPIDAETARITVRGQGFRDVWTWQAAPDNETASSLSVERVEGDREGFPFTVDERDTHILWKHIDFAAAE